MEGEYQKNIMRIKNPRVVYGEDQTEMRKIEPAGCVWREPKGYNA